MGSNMQIPRINFAERINTAQNSEVVNMNNQNHSQKATSKSAEVISMDQEYWRENFDKLLEKLNMIMRVSRVEFRREVHTDTGQIMVSILDCDTGEMLRQIPPERVLDMIAEMMKYLGLKVDIEA